MLNGKPRAGGFPATHCAFAGNRRNVWARSLKNRTIAESRSIDLDETAEKSFRLSATL